MVCLALGIQLPSEKVVFMVLEVKICSQKAIGFYGRYRFLPLARTRVAWPEEIGSINLPGGLKSEVAVLHILQLVICFYVMYSCKCPFNLENAVWRVARGMFWVIVFLVYLLFSSYSGCSYVVRQNYMNSLCVLGVKRMLKLLWVVFQGICNRPTRLDKTKKKKHVPGMGYYFLCVCYSNNATLNIAEPHYIIVWLVFLNSLEISNTDKVNMIPMKST